MSKLDEAIKGIEQLKQVGIKFEDDLPGLLMTTDCLLTLLREHREEDKKREKLLVDANRGAERNIKVAESLAKKNIALTAALDENEATKILMYRIKELKKENEILNSALHPVNSPCGHSGQYAYTADGGKYIVCLLCVKQENEKLKDLISSAAPLRWAFHNGPDIIKEAGEWEKLAHNLITR